MKRVVKLHTGVGGQLYTIAFDTYILLVGLLVKDRSHSIRSGVRGVGRLGIVNSEGEDLMKIKWCMKATSRYFRLKLWKHMN